MAVCTGDNRARPDRLQEKSLVRAGGMDRLAACGVADSINDLW
jgi:hypothetical protein